jgi:hypothetical protein
MPRTWTTERFPQFESQIRRLTEQHCELDGEPLHLAISYAPGRDQQDIFLLEVIGGNGAERVSLDRELFETTFASAPGFPMPPTQRLHLVLTNRHEFDVALDEKWPSVVEILDAILLGDYVVLFQDETGTELLNRILAESHRMEGALRG